MSFYCNICSKQLSLKNKQRHDLSPYHILRFNRANNIQTNPEEPEPEPEYYEPPVTETIDDPTYGEPQSEDFLEELNNVNYTIVEEPLEKIPKMKPIKIPKVPKVKKVVEPVYADDEELDDIFSDKPTQILGREKLLLIQKIKSYKQLFSKELKTFRIKKNANLEELKQGLEEIQIKLSLGSVDTFVTEAILSSLKMLEGVSTKTRYNISGLSDLLQSNAQFSSLTRQLYMKYNTFSNVPPEVQLGMLIVTSSYIVVMQNQQGLKQTNDYLNKPK